MDQINLPHNDELQSLLDEIEALAPTRGKFANVSISYRPVATDDIIEDSLPFDDTNLEDAWVDQETSDEKTVSSPIMDFQSASNGPLLAVDCGIARLGETENGLVIALRATIVTIQDGASEISLYRSGPIYLHNGHKLQIMHRMGQHLGKPDHFVELDETDPVNPKPVRLKSGVAYDAHKYGDRFRNWFERLIQKIATTKITNGIILFDGALTLRTLDTPDLFLEQLAKSASTQSNAVIAISKQSLLQVQGKPIRFWLDEASNRPCYRCLTSLMRREENERVLGNVYAARFSAIGPTFRMDVKSVEGQSDDEAINQFWSSALMRGGYPDILVRAHTHSYFTSADVVELQAQTGAKYQLVPRAEIDLSGIFGPFGGRFK